MIYEYTCEKCGEYEQDQPMTANALKKCPKCGGKTERIISGGSGFILPNEMGKKRGYKGTMKPKGQRNYGNDAPHGISQNWIEKNTWFFCHYLKFFLYNIKMRVRQVKKSTALMFDGVVTDKEKIRKIFQDIKKVSADFVITDSNNQKINIIKVLEINDDNVKVLEQVQQNRVKRWIKYEDIMDIYMEFTSEMDRSLYSNEWRALEIWIIVLMLRMWIEKTRRKTMAKQGVWQGQQIKLPEEYVERLKTLENLQKGTSDNDIIAMAEILTFVLQKLSELERESGHTDAFVR
jgi:putative FmdB family regulatory protein